MDEVGLVTVQIKSCYTPTEGDGMETWEALLQREGFDSGDGCEWRVSAAANEKDETLARGRHDR